MRRFILFFSIIFIFGNLVHNALAVTSYYDCLVDSSYCSWSNYKYFYHSKPCTQGPDSNSICTMGIKYRDRTCNTNGTQTYDFTIDKLYFSSKCSNNCFDCSLLTEATYWLLVDNYIKVHRSNPLAPDCINSSQGINASCYSTSINSATFLAINTCDSSFNEIVNTSPANTNLPMVSLNSVTLTNVLIPCNNSGCCKVEYSTCAADWHNYQDIDVFAINSADPGLQMYLLCDTAAYMACEPKCQEFADFQVYYKRNIEIKDNKNEIIKDVFSINQKNEILNLNLNNKFRGSCKVIIFNLKSELIFEKSFFKSVQNYNYDININSFSNGFYNIIINQSDGEIYHEKINIIR